LTLKLIHDDGARAEVRKRVEAADLDKTIYSTEEAKYFTDAFDYLIANHERLKNEPEKKAIRIPLR